MGPNPQGNPIPAERKRAREDEDSDDETAGHGMRDTIMDDHSGGSNQPAKTARSAQPYHTGEQYRAKKARGDLRGKDQKVDPYAFLPLDRRQLMKSKKTSGAVRAHVHASFCQLTLPVDIVL
eukprot:COSAG05_NODE_1593_length_4463_cov_18.956920_1_plen_122_part_00